MKTCTDLLAKLGEKVGCCGSCHNDEEQGYSAFSEVTFEGEVYEACCSLVAATDVLKLKAETINKVKT